MPRLLLIKHSHPIADLDSPPATWELSERGRHRAGLLAEYLADRNIDALYSSGEVKAVQTAEFVSTTTGLPIHIEPDLREHERENTQIIDDDEWRSLVIESIRHPDELIYGTEPVATARDRFGVAIDRLMNGRDRQTVAIVAHGTVISTFLASLLKIDPIPIWDSLGLPGFVEFDWPRPSKVLTRQNFE
jgi:probable phosphoglycerate mutase